MQKIIWQVEYTSLPKAVRYCKKCGVKSEFVSSGMFRVNAQQKYLDVWLIYKCSRCDSTWNLTLYTRVNPKSLPTELLKGFHCNDERLAAKFAMDIGLLRKNGAELTLPAYDVAGEMIDLANATELHLISEYPSDLKVASILRKRLGLSRKDFELMLDNGRIRCVTGHDLRKCKLNDEIVMQIGG